MLKNPAHDVFHSQSYLDIANNFKTLCLDNLGYEFVKNYNEVYSLLNFNYSDYSVPDRAFIPYVIAKDCGHFRKPSLIRREGLVIETDLEGWLKPEGKKISLRKLELKNFKIHGYGKSWEGSNEDSKLECCVRKGLAIPMMSKLEVLSEELMQKAIRI